jgi:hypothetical protein
MVPAAIALCLTLISAASMPRWRMPDLHWKDQARGIDGPRPCTIVINPGPPWCIQYAPPVHLQLPH